jgi:hypothetical protein
MLVNILLHPRDKADIRGTSRFVGAGASGWVNYGGECAVAVFFAMNWGQAVFLSRDVIRKCIIILEKT